MLWGLGVVKRWEEPPFSFFASGFVYRLQGVPARWGAFASFNN